MPKPLAPGMYLHEGTVHIVSDEMAEHFDVPYDWLEDNLERLLSLVMAEKGGRYSYTETEDPPPWELPSN